MSSISALGSANIAWLPDQTANNSSVGLASVAATTQQAPAPESQAAATAETTASLGSASQAVLVYEKPLVTNWSKQVWSGAATDEISQLMGRNMQSTGLISNPALLLDGLGEKLLGRFGTTQTDFQQTVAQYPAVGDSGKLNDVGALQQAKYAQNSVNLTLRTVSGKQIDITIGYGGDGSSSAKGLSVEVHTQGQLSAEEQAAVKKLSAGFETALKSIGNVASTTSTQNFAATVDLSGLVDFDTKVLSSVDLKFSSSAQSSSLKSLAFHADIKSRSFSMSGAVGNLSMAVDLSKPEIWGSEDQRKQSISRYLDQFDSANQRAHSDGKLMAQFKSVFSQLQSAYPANAGALMSQSRTETPNAREVSLLSGLADFQAQMGGDFDDSSTNKVVTMTGHMDYRVTQQTEIRGENRDKAFSLGQQKNTRLTSNYVSSRMGAMLDTGNGNYDIFHISDESSSSILIEYVNGKLKSATITTEQRQYMEYIKLVDHKETERKETPRSDASVLDVAGQLQAQRTIG